MAKRRRKTNKQSKCDYLCGNMAVMKIGKLNLCDECASAHDDDWHPRLRFEDVISIVNLLDGEVL